MEDKKKYRVVLAPHLRSEAELTLNLYDQEGYEFVAECGPGSNLWMFRLRPTISGLGLSTVTTAPYSAIAPPPQRSNKK